MPFQLNQLDRISDPDQAIEYLQDEYIPELLEVFGNSPEGQAYLETLPEPGYAGDWIGNLIYFGYAYLEITLPKMKERDVEEILLGLFPRKISLMDPDEAEQAIPELIAFWQFMQREYKHRSSKKILAFLQKIHPTFKDRMNDPRNFGIAKSFMMAGQAAGFDMTTQAGVEAYQQQYNQQIRETGAPPPGFPALPSPMGGTASQNPLSAFPIPEGVPPEFVALLSQQMGLGPVPGLEHLPTDPNQLAEAIAHHLVESGDVILDESHGPDEEEGDFFSQLQTDMLQRTAAEQGTELSEAAIALLQQQTITDSTPGTILKDFQSLLDAMGDRGLPVSGKLHHLTRKGLGELNAQLSQPIQIDMKQPQQKSYPNLHGLYLLLRATGMTEVVTVGKTAYLRPNSTVLESWQALNPTEQYLTLLEAWIIRGDAELLGDRRSPLGEGTRVLQVWPALMNQRKTYRNYSEQNSLSYWPGFHNLALMQMFGWVEITSAKPESGKGWRIKQVNPLPLGDALVTALLHAYEEQDFVWEAQENFAHPWGELQPYLQPYFPEWQQNLADPEGSEHQTGTYIFKVSLDKSWRRISISSESSLATFAALILQSVNFDSDHLDMFEFKDRIGRTIEIHHPANDWQCGPYTDQVTIGDLPLKPGMTMTYLFDFGDNWEFDVLLETIEPGKPKRNSNQILERHGKAPEQYPDYDDYDDDD